MSKRLQVLLPEEEMADIQKAADAEQVSVGEWVRRTLRAARKQDDSLTLERKLAAIHRAMTWNLAPACDADQMNAEIEQGYLKDLP